MIKKLGQGLIFLLVMGLIVGGFMAFANAAGTSQASSGAPGLHNGQMLANPEGRLHGAMRNGSGLGRAGKEGGNIGRGLGQMSSNLATIAGITLGVILIQKGLKRFKRRSSRPTQAVS